MSDYDTDKLIQSIKEIRVTLRMKAKQVRFNIDLEETFVAGYLCATVDAENDINKLLKLYQRASQI